MLLAIEIVVRWAGACPRSLSVNSPIARVIEPLMVEPVLDVDEGQVIAIVLLDYAAHDVGHDRHEIAVLIVEDF